MAFQRMLVDLGPLAMFGELNSSRYSNGELAERGLSGSQAPGCRRTLALKPYGEQSEPGDPFPVFTGCFHSADSHSLVAHHPQHVPTTRAYPNVSMERSLLQQSSSSACCFTHSRCGCVCWQATQAQRRRCSHLCWMPSLMTLSD